MHPADEHLIEVDIVESDAALRSRIVDTLEPFGFRAHVHGTIRDLHLRLRQHGCGLLVLDVDLPSADGLEVIGQLRETYEIGIVALTRRATTERVVHCLSGVDTWLRPPFDPQALAEHLFSLHRRIRGQDRPGAPNGRWRLDGGGWLLRSPDGRQVPLTAPERDLLIVLTGDTGSALQRDSLIRALTGCGGPLVEHRLDRLVDGLQRRVREYTGLPLPLAPLQQIADWLQHPAGRPDRVPLTPAAG